MLLAGCTLSGLLNTFYVNKKLALIEKVIYR
jgi:hypothetical protein